jgi:serine/threonine protein kinase
VPASLIAGCSLHRHIACDSPSSSRESQLTPAPDSPEPGAPALPTRFRFASGSSRGSNTQGDLEEIVANEGPMAPARAVRLLRQVAGALHEAHTAGLTHRDITPGNVMVCERGGVPD